MARQVDPAALDDQLLVDGVVADLTVLVRQAALAAGREALGTEAAQRRSQPARKPRPKRTRVVELVSAAPIKPAPRVDDTQLRVVVVEHLAAHPDLNSVEPAAALYQPLHVKRGLTALVPEERVVARATE